MIVHMEPESHPPDQLDLEISAAREAVADMQRELQTRQITLSALERAAALRPRAAGNVPLNSTISAIARSVATGRAPGTRGKAPGTISGQWRSIMAAMVKGGNQPLTPELVAVLADANGYRLEVKAVRDWLRRAAASEHRFIEREGDACRVSAAAIERFHFQTAAPSREVPSDGAA